MPMNSVCIRIDENQYLILQNYIEYYEKLVYAHFSFRKSIGVEPEIIVGLMYEKYFSKPSHHVRFGVTGKLFRLSYPEAKSLWSLMSTEDSLGILQIRAQIDQELTNWRPSYMIPNIKDWYNKEAPVHLRDTFGDFDELDDISYEIVIESFNAQIK